MCVCVCVCGGGGSPVRGLGLSSHPPLTTFRWQGVICCVSDFYSGSVSPGPFPPQCEYLSERL